MTSAIIRSRCTRLRFGIQNLGKCLTLEGDFEPFGSLKPSISSISLSIRKFEATFGREGLPD
jgi:hypothetical protein